MVRDITLHLILVYLLPAPARAQGIANVNAALEAGALHPIIGARFPLREAVQAHQAVERSQFIGNIILDVEEHSFSR